MDHYYYLYFKNRRHEELNPELLDENQSFEPLDYVGFYWQTMLSFYEFILFTKIIASLSNFTEFMKTNTWFIVKLKSFVTLSLDFKDYP
jgi:hypothetical protein